MKCFRAPYIYIVDCYDLVKEAGQLFVRASSKGEPDHVFHCASLFAICFLLFTPVQCCWLFAAFKFLLGGCGCLVFGVFT